MKLTNTQNMNSKSGMTLLELTVVILVLLSLISILFVGARAWKKGSDKSANFMNLRNTQQAMRGHQNLNNLKVGDAFTKIQLANYMKFPSSVSTITYDSAELIPAVSSLWLTATYGTDTPDTEFAPLAAQYEGW